MSLKDFTKLFLKMLRIFLEHLLVTFENEWEDDTNNIRDICGWARVALQYLYNK